MRRTQHACPWQESPRTFLSSAQSTALLPTSTQRLISVSPIFFARRPMPIRPRSMRSEVDNTPSTKALVTITQAMASTTNANGSLGALPGELQNKIFQYLDGKSHLSLGATNHYFRRVADLTKTEKVHLSLANALARSKAMHRRHRREATRRFRARSSYEEA
ncbi:hypothetical protein IWX90DRAFT_429614 [Phyllosticta citrichinensis]|uniref:F-box domain-containing protein n=1 Tax=Phyllosticta citrichinensis TaxID=1130410 RepID=A0ABR1XVG1_9PEZI